VRKWTHGDATEEIDVSELVDSVFREHRLGASVCLQNASAQIEQLLQDDPDSAFDDAAFSVVMDADGDPCSQLIGLLNAKFGVPPEQQEVDYQNPSLCLDMIQQVDNEAMIVGDQISTALIGLLDQPQFDLAYATAGKAAIGQRLKSEMDQLEAQHHRVKESTTTLLLALQTLLSEGRIKPANADQAREIVTLYVAQRREDVALRFARRYCKNCTRALAYTEERFQQYRRQLETMSSMFAAEESSQLEEAKDRFSMDQLLVDSIERDQLKHVNQTEIQVYESLIRPQGGYLAAMSAETCWQRRLPIAIRLASKAVLADAYQKLSLDQVIANHGIRLEQLFKWLNEKFNAARPVVDDCGGASRVMIGLPALSSDGATLPAMVREQFNVTASSVNGTRGNVVICFEAEDVSLASVAYRLMESRPDALDLAPRLHTRTDVDWKSLNDLL
jgi:hypothetical protein